MTENEAIRDLQYLIEEYSAYPPETGVSATIGSLQYCISALKEIQQYREIGTVEECRKAKRFKEYFDELYGIGLEVANWHQNGNTEPFDNFYDAAIDWSEQNE